jgi:GDP-4-dehydro-6-deoxy-D-mannose reductase
MKYLITGISGFVGGHYLEYLASRAPGARILGLDITRPEMQFLKKPSLRKIEFYKGSLLDKGLIAAAIKQIRPDYIINMASYSSVRYAWENPAECFINNTNIFLNLIEAARDVKCKAKILSIGSSEEYGIVKRGSLPLTEKSPLNPANPYAIARLAQEGLSKVYAAGYRMPIICTRSFNHMGPRQKDIFAVSSFAKQIVEGKLGLRKNIICGNLDIVRDFIDVRDVVRAYDLLLRKGKIGEIYNVCSGEGHKLGKILAMLQKKAGTKLPAKEDARLVRPVDNPVIVGSPGKLERDTEFRRKYTLSRSLDDILEYWRRACSGRK